jgi:histone acetyltransferase (RNA polymerase elongator complex component)
MGLQHTDDMILDKLNRECNQEQIKRAIQLSKDEGFKIDIHIMPDLPGSTIEKDKEMFDILFQHVDYRADQWKIYPTNVLEFTKIKEWYDNGLYKPYAESNFEGFIELLLYVMKQIPPYVRVNRIQRDFPGTYIEGGNKITNLRQVLDVEMRKRNIKTNDIRTMEIKDNQVDVSTIKLVRYDYESSGGKEIFLSMKSCSCKICIPWMIYKMKRMINKDIGYYGCGNENKIYGFLGLRLSENSGKEAFTVLQKKGLIRELHVYGKVKSTYLKNKSKSQHLGLGGILIREAEKITKQEKPHFTGMSVISGVGVREYYRKFGYEIPEKENLHGDFMIKYF